MAFRYTGQYTPPQLTFGAQPQRQQEGQQQSFNPMQAYNMYQQFAGGGSAAGGSGGLSGLSGLGLGSGGLGGSGLIGSAGGATSAASTGGAGFGLGGSLVGGTGTVGGSTFAAGAGGSAAGGSAAGGAASAIGSAGPWAALAAIIIGNEVNAKKKGYRDENKGKYAQDLVTGKVLTQDIENRWEPMFDKWTGGKASEWGFTGDMKGASQIGSFRFGKGLKTLWNDGTIGKIRDLF